MKSVPFHNVDIGERFVSPFDELMYVKIGEETGEGPHGRVAWINPADTVLVPDENDPYEEGV